jgi:hypothetical protein
MSCPNTAGNAAIIREYLTSGYYPSGSMNLADGLIIFKFIFNFLIF